MTDIETPSEIGYRLEDVVEAVLVSIKKKGIIKGYKRYGNVHKPDFEVVVDEDSIIAIGIECKNWDPEKKNDIDIYVLETSILSRFEGMEYKQKILLIPKLKFYSKEKDECRELLKDYNINILEIGSFITKEMIDEENYIDIAIWLEEELTSAFIPSFVGSRKVTETCEESIDS
jgi:hypothetical protein